MSVVIANGLVIKFPNHDERNQVLLHQISQQYISNSPAAAAAADASEHVLTVRNASGHTYSCISPIETPPTIAAAEDEENKPDAPPVQFSQEALDAKLPLLQDACVTFNAGWWTTKWCHATEAKQYHLENNKEMITYSLGKFTSSQIQFEKDTPLFLVEKFEHGQICDETGVGRKIEVRLYCCPAEDTTIPQSTDQTVPTFFSWQETTVCSYTMMLCWQPLCDVGLAPLSRSNKDAWAALRPMTGLCFQRADDTSGSDWVHEVCFERSARVFRQVKDTTAPADGKNKAKAAARILQVDNKHMGSFVDNQITNSNGVEVVQIYNNGDVCGNDGTKFSTRVRLSCFLSKSSSPEIVSFQVTSKCETEVLLHAPGLCGTLDSTRTATRAAAAKERMSLVTCIRE